MTGWVLMKVELSAAALREILKSFARWEGGGRGGEDGAVSWRSY
jgi:hypothetical protein